MGLQKASMHLALHGVRDVIQISCALIGEVVKHIEGLLGLAAALLHPKDEVQPGVQVL